VTIEERASSSVKMGDAFSCDIPPCPCRHQQQAGVSRSYSHDRPQSLRKEEYVPVAPEVSLPSAASAGVAKAAVAICGCADSHGAEAEVTEIVMNRKWQKLRSYRTSNTLLPVDLLVDFGLNPFDFAPEAMAHFFLQMVQFLGLQESFGLPSSTIQAFANGVLASYRDVPYHNSCHAFSITQFLFTCFIKCKAISLLMSQQDKLAVFIAALAHDADHPGNNNAWEVATKSELAVRYDDVSVLENHHIAVGLKLMEDSSRDVFGSSLQAYQKMEVSKTFSHSILMTDMAQHNAMVDQLKSRTSGDSGFDRENPDDCRAVCGILLHSVDISNPLLPKFELCKIWAVRINQEFMNQYAHEKDQGMPLTKMWENIDNPCGFSKSQIGFGDFIVTPLWNSLFVQFPELQSEGHLRDALEENHRQWVQMNEDA